MRLAWASWDSALKGVRKGMDGEKERRESGRQAGFFVGLIQGLTLVWNTVILSLQAPEWSWDNRHKPC